MSDWVAIDACPLCGSGEREPWLIALQVPLIRCAGCGHRYASRVLMAEVLSSAYYDEPEAALAERSNVAKQQRFSEYLQLLGARARTPGWVLDVGCNAGELLEQFQRVGYRPFGIEMSPGPARHAAKRLGVEIWQGRVEDCLPSALSFDLITLSHVLEHIHHPTALLRRLRDALLPGAQLLIEVPNARDLLLTLWRGAYRPLCPGDHISFFDAASLGRLLTETGFRVQRLASITHARDLVYPSLLSAVDIVRSRRSRSSAPEGGVQAQARYRGRLRRPLRTAIDAAVGAVDPGVMRAMRGWTQRMRGAVLVAVAEPAS